MPDSRRFRRELAARILGLMGASSLAVPATGCNVNANFPGYGGAGGAGGATSIGGTGGTGSAGGAGGTTTTTTTTTSATVGDSGVPIVQDCFKWSANQGPCPTSTAAILNQFQCCGCIGWEPARIDSPPTVDGDGNCCYQVEMELCSAAGRPYLVDAEPRVAAVERAAGSRGWREGDRPCLDGLTAETRAALAAAWTEDALLEHASVASFSRASLALLAAGAPANLMARTHAAALDEIRHARLCFTLAAAYAGEDVAPGPFPLGEVVPIPPTLAEIAVSTVKEGCLGETVAAVLAAEQLARAADPAVRAALAQIAADEARHAELAWRTVAWAVQAGGDEVRVAVERAFRDVPAGACDARRETAGPPTAMEAHGRVDRATVAAVAAAAIAEIVVPAASALLRRAASRSEPPGDPRFAALT